ncbi:MAG: FAD:protein FMN transferase [Gammaproteobacteria bacterium]|nr:FAD:protein FMN transferase [Gammaproteobacteria bacterium]
MSRLELFTFPFKAMGSPCELRLYANDKKTASQIANDAIAEVNRLEIKYSRYRNDSVTTKINNSAGNKNGIKIDTETALLLNYAQVGYEQSAGLFDITSGILRKAWDFRSNKIPEQQEIEALLPLIGWNKLIWNPSILCLPLQGMELDFGGYVKEYAADVAANFCILAGIQGGLVNLGGDICIIGPHPDGSPWKVGIRHPRNPSMPMSFVMLSKGGLASSGDYERFMMVDGIRYAHILNPHTGMPVNTLASTSVCAEQCVVAGTSSTIAMLKGEQQGAAWLEELGLPYLCMNQNEEVFGTLKHVSSSEE